MTIITSGMWVETTRNEKRGRYVVKRVTRRGYEDDQVVLLRDGSGGVFERVPEDCIIVSPPTSR